VKHPLVFLAERWGRGPSLVILGVIAIGPSVILPEGHPATAVGFVAVVILGTTGWEDAVEATQPTELERAKELYRDGRITHDELERRLDLILDEDAQRIMSTVEEIAGVGPELASTLALEYGSERELATATKDELEEIHGIGPSTAEAIVGYTSWSEEAAASSTRAASRTATATDGGGRR